MYFRIELMDYDNVWKYVEYLIFNVEFGSFKYRFYVNGYLGNVGKLVYIM